MVFSGSVPIVWISQGSFLSINKAMLSYTIFNGHRYFLILNL